VTYPFVPLSPEQEYACLSQEGVFPSPATPGGCQNGRPAQGWEIGYQNMAVTKLTAPNHGVTFKRLVFVFVVATILVRLLTFVWSAHQHSWRNGPFGYEYTYIALSILDGNGYSSPFSPPPTGPTMWHPPIVTFVLAGIFRVFGVCTLPAYVTWILINAFLCGVCSFLIVLIAKRAFGTKTALLSQAIYVFNMFEIYKFQFMPANLADEVFITLFILIGLAGFIYVKGAVGRGLLGGFLLLAHPMAFLAYLVLILVAFLRKAISLGRLATVFVVTLLTVSPLIIRNYAVMGGFSLTKSNFFFEAYICNVPESKGILTPEIHRNHHPQSNVQERKLMAELGELKYVKRYRQKFFEMVRQEPLRLLKLTLRRINYFWIDFVDYAKVMYPHKSGMEIALVQVYYGLSLCSLLFCMYTFLVKERRDTLTQAIVMIPLIYSLPYAITHVSVRYRTPIEPVLMILISASIFKVYELLYSGPRNPRRPISRASTI
jgi:hypothetical protein